VAIKSQTQLLRGVTVVITDLPPTDPTLQSTTGTLIDGPFQRVLADTIKIPLTDSIRQEQVRKWDLSNTSKETTHQSLLLPGPDTTLAPIGDLMQGTATHKDAVLGPEEVGSALTNGKDHTEEELTCQD